MFGFALRRFVYAAIAALGITLTAFTGLSHASTLQQEGDYQRTKLTQPHVNGQNFLVLHVREYQTVPAHLQSSPQQGSMSAIQADVMRSCNARVIGYSPYSRNLRIEMNWAHRQSCEDSLRKWVQSAQVDRALEAATEYIQPYYFNLVRWDWTRASSVMVFLGLMRSQEYHVLVQINDNEYFSWGATAGRLIGRPCRSTLKQVAAEFNVPLSQVWLAPEAGNAWRGTSYGDTLAHTRILSCR